MNQSGKHSGAGRRRTRRGGSGGRGRGGRSPRRPSGPPVEPLHPVENPPEIDRFDEFDLHETVLKAIADMDIVKPTPIQALTTQPVLEGRDVIAKAETGTGKTLAFGAPMISKIDADRVTVLGLVLCPTRELAEQVAVVLEKLGEPRDIKVALIVGGEPAGPQVAALQAGAQVVVGTPGRVIDLYEQKFLSFPWTEFVVLDEADEMLEIGFIDDVKKILNFTPDERQTLLFSATFPDALLRLARDYTKNPAEIATASGVKTVDNITQEYIALDDAERPLALIRMIEQSEEKDVFLVFCERRTEVERLMRRLERLSFSIKALHGGYDQQARFRVMGAFRTGEVKVLVATDVASRGLDVNHVTHVVNFSVPRSITDYTHRIGRTGRAGREGHATTLVTHEHMHRWKILLRDANWEIEQVEAPSGRGRRGPAREERSRSSERRPRRDEESRERGRARDGERESRRDSESSRDRDRDRDRTRDRDRDRDRNRDSDSRRGRSDERRRESSSSRDASERQPQRRELDTDPVQLPSGRAVRKRDPNDPPRRVRLPKNRESAGEDREERPARRSREESTESERPRSRSRGEAREDRPERDAERPHRRRREESDESSSERPVERPRRTREESSSEERAPIRRRQRTDGEERSPRSREESRPEQTSEARGNRNQRNDRGNRTPERDEPITPPKKKPGADDSPASGGFGSGV